MLVAPVVFTARKACSQKTKHGEDHVGGLVFRDSAELFEVDLIVVAEAAVEDCSHFFQRIDSFLESRSSTAFLSEFTLTITCGNCGRDDRHASNDSGDVALADLLVVVKVVYVEDELHLLVEAGAVYAQQAS